MVGSPATKERGGLTARLAVRAAESRLIAVEAIQPAGLLSRCATLRQRKRQAQSV
jgi:hypothetical protein